MNTHKENKYENKLIYNANYVSNNINTYLGLVEFESMVIFPLVFNKDDFEYLNENYENPSKDLNQHQYLNLLFIDSILSDYKRTDEDNEIHELEVSFNQSTINKLNGILYSHEKKIKRCVSLDEIIKKLIDDEYSRNRNEHYQSYKELRKVLGVVEDG